MDFQTAVQTCFQKYATFDGRAPRSELWWFVLFNVLVGIVLNIVDGVLFHRGFGHTGVLGLIFNLAVLLPSLAVGARRLHDLGKSGWWQLLLLIPLIGALVLIYWYIQEGEDRPNDYGPPTLVTH